MTKSDLLAAMKREPVRFDVPNGPPVLLRPWSAADRAEFAVWRKANPGPVGLCAKLFAMSACDPSGALLFSAEDVAEIDKAEGAGVAIEAIADRVIALNGLGSAPGN